MLCVLIFKWKPCLNVPVKAALLLGPLRDASPHKTLQQFQKRPAASTYICIPLTSQNKSGGPGSQLAVCKVTASRERHSCSLSQKQQKKLNEKEAAFICFVFS